MQCCIVFFFFQAEDGIRDYKVTGVQTCALPICLCRPHSYADLSVNWLARGPVVAGVIGIILSLSRIVTIDACLVTIAVAGDVNSLEAAMNGRQRAAHPSRVKVTGPLAGYADGFRQALAERGYHPQVIGRQALLMADLSVWLESCGLSGGALTPEVTGDFVRDRRAS